jgi:hypothetical protein
MSDGVRRLKNLFKKDASKVIVKLLLPYQRDDAIVGRIDSTEDFKHLAKKVRQISLLFYIGTRQSSLSHIQLIF